MRQLPPLTLLVSDIQAGTASWQMEIVESLDYFTGHFPNHPILPGIVLVDWAITLARTLFTETHAASIHHLQQVERLKFNAPVFPQQHLQLEVQLGQSKSGQTQLQFLYTRIDTPDQTTVASGRVLSVP